MADLEPRVVRLEDTIIRLEATIIEMRVTLGRIEQRLASTATMAQAEYLRGRVEQLPTTWVMLVGIIGGQVALAGLIAAVVFGVAHVMGKV